MGETNEPVRASSTNIKRLGPFDIIATAATLEPYGSTANLDTVLIKLSCLSVISFDQAQTFEFN